MTEEFHVSSLIVHARPGESAAVHAAIAVMEGAEIHAEQAGRMIVTLETGDEQAIVARLTEISLLDGVLSAVLVYHHVEPGEPSWS